MRHPVDPVRAMSRQLGAANAARALAGHEAALLMAENARLKKLLRRARTPPDDGGLVLTYGEWLPDAPPTPRRGGWGAP